MTKVSVIIPVHNAGVYLRTCLNSVVNQTLKDIEIICINDHSMDDSLNILREYENKYPKLIKVVDMQENYGVSWARNIGLKLAQGEYIGFVDADDLIALNMYEDFVNISKECNSDIVIGWVDRITSKECLNMETFKAKKITGSMIEPYLIKENSLYARKQFLLETPAVWDKLFKHDFIGDTKFLENHIYEDIAFSYPLLLKTNNLIAGIKSDYYLYRDTPHSIMNNSGIDFNDKIFDIFDIVTYARNLSAKFNLTKEKEYLLNLRLNQEFLYKIDTMSKWDFLEKEEFMSMLKSLYNFYFHKSPRLYGVNDIYLDLMQYESGVVESDSEAKNLQSELLTLIRKQK